MKTYNGKNITKKHITEVLRSRNLTEIFKLVHQIYGGKTNKHEVFDFVSRFAPSDKVADDIHNAIVFAYDRHFKFRNFRREAEFHAANAIHIAVNHLREEIARGIDNYTKRPILGITHLYFCSPAYGHRDYNKHRSIAIKGNERFCELMVRLADKYIPMCND